MPKSVDRESGATKHLITDHNIYVEGAGFVAYTLCGWLFRDLEGGYYKYAAWWENVPDVCPHCLHALGCSPYAAKESGEIACPGCLAYFADQEAGHPADRTATQSAKTATD